MVKMYRQKRYFYQKLLDTLTFMVEEGALSRDGAKGVEGGQLPPLARPKFLKRFTYMS